MLSKNLENAAEKLGFKTESDHAYGLYGGFLVSLYEDGGKKSAFINFHIDRPDELPSVEDQEDGDIGYEETDEVVIDDEESPFALTLLSVSNGIKKHIEQYKITDYNTDSEGLLITASCDISSFLSLIDIAVELLQNNGIVGQDCCSHCGNGFGKRNPKKVSFGRQEHLMCESCSLTALENHDQRMKSQNAEKNTGRQALAVCGSIAGGALGFLVYWIVYSFFLGVPISDKGIDFRYIFCIAGFLTGVLCYYGYRLIYKRISPSATVTVMLTSVLFTSIGQYIGYIVYILRDNSLKFGSFPDYKWLFLAPFRSSVLEGDGYSTDFYKFLILSILFAIAGALIMILGMYESKKIKNVPLKVETLRIKKV